MVEKPTRARVSAAFIERFDAAPRWVARAPGRVNLIGGHTDYNEGYVLPMAIDRHVWIALRPRPDSRVIVHALDNDERASFDLSHLQRGVRDWTAYLQGTAWALLSAGMALRGWEGVLSGDVPIGAGLSSSAALELATARAFVAAADLPWDAMTVARLARRAENEWVGVPCGIMDQVAAAAGREGHALLLDCRTVGLERIALPADVATVVLDTGTRRRVADSAYNQRRAECQAAAAFFGVPSLRDVSAARFERESGRMDPVLRKRARHVIGENARVLAAAEALRREDLVALGGLIDASHASLRDDFSVSGPELDAMVTAARAHPACLGARMTGAGFGGCTLAVVGREDVADFTAFVQARYFRQTGHRPEVYVCAASDGASLVGAA